MLLYTKKMENMDAIILCGGFATRLEPIGEFIPKALLTLNGRPLVDYIINGLERINKIDRIVISTNKKFADQFNYWMRLKQKSGFKKRLQLVVEPTTKNEKKFGAVKGIYYTIEKARIRGDLLVIAGDNFYTFNLGEVLSKLSAKHKPSMVLYDIKSLENAKRFGVVKVHNGIITELEEKPERPSSSLISTGIYFYPKEMLGMFKKYIRYSENTDEPGRFVKWFISFNEMHAVVPKSGEWFDIGTLDGYKRIFYSNGAK